jgi:4-deoxy-L-threo-5-hexosulose-uronate ketol-isomerase
MYTKIFYATHPGVLNTAQPADLRDLYLIENLFRPDAIALNYAHQERLIVGGAMPVINAVTLPRHTEPASLAGAPFLVHREMAAVNVGSEAGRIFVDGHYYELEPMDALYIGRGAEAVSFEPSAKSGARYYLASTPAHCTFDHQLIKREHAPKMTRGSSANANERTIRQYVVPTVCKSAQLLLGLTILEPGSVWNTMPPHTHDRRSEIYFYFHLPQEERVFHFMGTPQNTRSIVVSNEQAIICPPWSIHMGAGTASYAFIWAMGGENLDYSDMHGIEICQLL